MRICDLRHKEVINCRDGERLGFVCDIEFDICTGCVISLIVPGPCKIWGIIGRDHEFVIPWKCIRQIGSDIILVDVEPERILVKCE
ncbi:MAG: YlmC/YmxH family sporulation protein [Lachnospiraceae bacterium]|nr:YlmC/YmxH family sporulation protein [Lachnospiraceae bacterium]